MTKTPTANYLSIAAPGNSFNARISADSDIFARNDIDALGSGLELHDHTSGKGLPAGALATTVTLTGLTTIGGAAVTISGGALTVSTGGITITAGGLTVTAGNVGIGLAPLTDRGLYIGGLTVITTGTAQYGIVCNPSFSSAATVSGDAVYAQASTQAAAFTLPNAADFHAYNPVRGSGSTITSAYGLLVDSITTGGTNNYGIYINVPSGGSNQNYGLINLGSGIPNGSGTSLGFFGAPGSSKITVSGSRGANAALASLLTALSSYSLLVDSTTV